MGPMLLTVEQAAGLLGQGRTTIYAKVATGEIFSVKIGRSRRIPREALDAYVAGLTAGQAS